MPRIMLEEGLQELHADVLTLGSMVEKAIQRSVEALRTRDASIARRVIEEDAAINALRFQIEDRALLLIATQQPLVHDLRTVAAVLSIITDLERMGDHAEGTATISLMIGDEPLLKPLLDIPRMAETVTDMLRRVLLAFADNDIVAARRVAAEDDAVDALYNQVYRELLTFMIGDPRTIHQATLLLWAAHNLERIGDRVTNICERVIFTETGRMQEIRPSGALKMPEELR
ncbi:MAG: phosphate signaling complex protein PhoU [Thermomicrobiales bacterium]